MKLPSAGELAIMRVLKRARLGLYGLQIVNAAKGAVVRGGVYVQLGRLESKGYISAEPGDGRPRYTLTDTGRRVLRLIDSSTTDAKSTV